MRDTSDQIRQFVARDYGKVVAAVGAATGDRDAAEDGVQTALLKVIRDNHKPDQLAAWVTVVAINEVRQVHRRRKTEQRVSEQPTDTTTRPIEGLAAATDLRAAVAELPERQREIVLMFYYLDTSVTDIAAAMGISSGTVKTQLHRARATMATRLGIQEQGVT